VLYHEAAGGGCSPDTVSSGATQQRIQLLAEAYELAAGATTAAPNSLSCAALRATLAINLLVEESALLAPATAPQQPDAQHAHADSSSSRSSSSSSSSSSKRAAGSGGGQQQQQAGVSSAQLDQKCRELLARFSGSIDACRAALEHASPAADEPIITLVTPSHTTCDPCSLVSSCVDRCRASASVRA
jgi:hypothetical protein